MTSFARAPKLLGFSKSCYGKFAARRTFEPNEENDEQTLFE